MRIDAHQHFWKYDPAEYGWIDDTMAALRRDFLPPQARREMDAAGFDACVAVQARQTVAETRWLLDLADSHPFIAGVIGWVDLRSPRVEAELAALACHPRLVGIRHIAQSEPDGFLGGLAFQRGIAALERLGLTYDILVYPRQLGAALDLVEHFPGQVFVLDHLAKPEIRRGAIASWRRDVLRLAAHPNVCCKLSGLVTEADWRSWTAAQIHPYLEVAFEGFGARRLMIGSDWPVCTVAASYARAMDVVLEFLQRCTAEERAAVAGGTAERVWKLPPPGRLS